MRIKDNKSYGVVSTDILEVNNKEMQQMHELKNRINDILTSHKDENKKNEYISDEELTLMYAILSVFTKEYSSTQTSAFDDFLKEQEKPVEQPQQQDKKPQPKIPIGDDQLFG